MTPARKPPATANQFSRYGWEQSSIDTRMLICRGQLQMGILEVVRQLTEGRQRNTDPKKGPVDAIPEWTTRIVWSDYAKRWGCSAQSLRKEHQDFIDRGVYESREDGIGVNIRPRYDAWEEIAAAELKRRANRGLELVGKESDDEPVSEDPAALDKQAPVRRQFRAIRAGAAGKPAKVERFVREVKTAWDGPGEVTLEVAWENQKLTVSGTLTPNGVKQIRSENALLSASVPASLLADQIRERAGISIDRDGIRRIERALNGSIPLGFFLDALQEKAESVQNPRAGLAIRLAECQIGELWRLHQKAGPAPPKKKSATQELMKEL